MGHKTQSTENPSSICKQIFVRKLLWNTSLKSHVHQPTHDSISYYMPQIYPSNKVTNYNDHMKN
jgi:hypothetical protein